MKKYVLLAALSAVSTAQSQNLKFMSVNFRPDGSVPPTIRFFCSQNYDKAECMKDATALRKALAPYPTRLLGDWSFYLVTAGDWKELVRRQGGDPVSPAFSVLEQRATLLDGGLFDGSAARNKELLERFDMIGPALVNLAITHEMGHAICQERNERRADDYGKELREGNIPECRRVAEPNPERMR